LADAADILRRNGAAVEQRLRDALAACGDAPPRLLEAIGYSLLGGGKRMRPALVIESWRACAGVAADAPACDAALAAAAAVELVHTFSLVHDDLPAMDNDDLRRGRPTSHKVFGEAMAILAGDAMVMMAFDLLCRDGDAGMAAALSRELAVASGPAGMVGGQVLDMEGEGKSLSLPQLADLHRRKTGALIRASCRMGAIAAGAGVAMLDVITAYGQHAGLAFQIVDDLLDVQSTPQQLGKAAGKDAARGKNTYPALLGVEASAKQAAAQLDAALDVLKAFGPEADGLRTLARFVVERAS